MSREINCCGEQLMPYMEHNGWRCPKCDTIYRDFEYTKIRKALEDLIYQIERSSSIKRIDLTEAKTVLNN